MPKSKRDTSQLLAALRTQMADNPGQKLNAYIVPSVDAHQSEYIGDCDKRLAFISGFTGSRGLGVITENKAAMWTDGRYFLQADQEMDENWVLMKEGLPETPKVAYWLSKNLPENGRVGVDPSLMTMGSYTEWQRALAKNGHSIAIPSENLIDKIWADRPARSQRPVRILPIEFAGKSWQDKILEVRKLMKENNACLTILSALDDIAWLLNLRGSDIEYNPVFYSYVIIEEKFIQFFIDEVKINDEIRKFLTNKIEKEEYVDLKIDIQPYNSFFDTLKSVLDEIEQSAEQSKMQIWVPGNSSSYAVSYKIDFDRKIEKLSPVVSLKGVKNPIEVAGFRNSQIKDAVAHCEFLYWLENEIVKNNNTTLTEISVTKKFEELREKQKDYAGLSFGAISSSGPNAAITHYKPSPESDRPLAKNEIFLIDSGAQYLDGTTDTTRTVCFQEPSNFQKECFTRVLKGHIALATLIFPENTQGSTIDCIARRSLWDIGLNYMHGTGHGVGHNLCVHEGPAGFNIRSSTYTEGFKENMVVTIEPGYYEDGQFGIRIESLFLVVPAQTEYKITNFLTFEPLTLVPIQKEMIDLPLLNKEEKNWLNAFHQKCLKILKPELDRQKKPEILKWLQKQCEQIP